MGTVMFIKPIRRQVTFANVLISERPYAEIIGENVFNATDFRAPFPLSKKGGLAMQHSRSRVSSHILCCQ